MITKEEIDAAEARIRKYIRLTPVQKSERLIGEGCTDVSLKLENFQETGSFKLRGAFNKLLGMSESDRSKGVVAASTGNHGAAVARAAHVLSLPARVFVPLNADPSKLASIAADGAVIEKVGIDCVEAEQRARSVANAEGLTYVSPYNDLEVVAGQGSIGVELGRQLSEIDAVFIAVGGGGLISGVGGYLKSVHPNIEVIACSPENSAVMHHSLEAGRILEMESKPTLSDGTAGGMEPDSLTFDICKSVVDRSLLVSEKEIVEAMKLLIGEHHLLVEGAAGVAVAAFMQDRKRLAGRSVAIVLCGANISIQVLRKVLQ